METKDTLSSCLNSEKQQMQQIQDQAKKSYMVSFRQLHSHLKLLSDNDLKGTQTECEFKRAFATLFGQDVKTFIGTVFLNMDQFERNLTKKNFKRLDPWLFFKVLGTQFQMFIKSRIYLDDEYVVMTRNYSLQYTQLEILEFRNTLIQLMESVKKSTDERAQHKREHDSWVNERQMMTTKEKVDTSKALDASWLTQKAVGQNQKSRIQAADQEMMHMLMMQISDPYMMKSQWLRKPILQPYRNQSVIRQPTAFKSERPRISKPRFASQVDVNNDLSKPVTTHYLPKEREAAFVKPHHMITPSSFRWKPTGKFLRQLVLDGFLLERYSHLAQPRLTVNSQNGSNEDITNQYKCKQTLDVSADTLNLSAGTSFNPTKEELRVWLLKRLISDEQAMTSDQNSLELRIHNHSSEPSSSKLVPKVVPPADKTSTSRLELELLFHHHIIMLRSTYCNSDPNDKGECTHQCTYP
nr:hypothetical protein [Tanacetum cinerariifolium]